MISEALNIFNHPLIRFGNTQVTFWTIVHFIVVLVVAFVISRYTRSFFINRVLTHTKMEEGLKYVIAKIIGYSVFILGFLIGLETLGIDLTSFTVLAGALGLGIGFGLQNVINNFVSGLIMLSERLIQIGDRLDVGGYSGQLRKIGARSSILKTGENVTVIVPNSEFISGKVVNWGQGTTHQIRFDLEVGVSYDSDLHLVEKILLDVALANTHVLKNPLPSVELIEFGESSINFKLYVWTIDMTTKSSLLKSQLYFAIWDQFRHHKIEIPFPIQSLRLQSPLQLEIISKGAEKSNTAI